MNRISPASPLALDAKDVGRRPGVMHEIERTVGAPADFGNDVLSVAEGEPIELDLRMESVHEGVLVTGMATAMATGACVRCLDPIDHPVDARFQELFVWPDRAKHHRTVEPSQDDEAEHTIEDDLIDLDPVLRDAVLPALPFQPVCRDDCPGLCSECGARLEDDPDHHHDVIDPRWAALQGLGSLTDQAGTTDQEKRN